MTTYTTTAPTAALPMRLGQAEKIFRRTIRLILRMFCPQDTYLTILFHFLRWRTRRGA